MQDAMTMSGVETLPDYARLLAKFGRFEDTYIVHAAEGETVVPMQVLEKNPALKEMLFNQMRDMGLEPERYVVGNELNSLNPDTGQPEFFFKSLWSGIKKVLKVAAPVLGAIAGSFIPIPIVGPMLGSFVASKLAGYSTQGALLGAAASGIGAYALGGSAAAAAGGYTGWGGPSLGQSLYGGLSQAPSMGAGLSSLVSSAPAAIGMDTAASSVGAGYSLPFSSGLGAATSGAAAAAAPAAAGAAGGTGMFAGTVAQPIMDFALKNPGLVLAGGSMLASLLDKPEKIKPSLTNTETGYDVYSKDPDKYKIGNLGPAPVSYGDGSGYTVNNYAPIQPLPQIDYNSVFAQFPVQNPYATPVIAAKGGHIQGPGTGTSDSIPALLSDGEFVMTAKAVRGAGGGDRKKGARKMYQMMRQFEALHG